ncbi:MiaB/RimO family radical SAM methylthiotransferase [Candidatus Falkowbacteria bacterium]|nr:MiaB/RimO family radical SAM methylthiotransferase [Candidatus Falkowbacteria bacterium]
MVKMAKKAKTKKAKKYFIWVLGCQMNKSDGERIDAVLSGIGYLKTAKESEADLIVAVACSVRQSAIDRIYGKSRIWQKKRSKGELITILTGCVLDKDKNKLNNKFDLILSILEINQLPSKLGGLKVIEVADYFHLKPSPSSKFQAYVPIMTGCNNFCSYCVVPYVRGKEISRPAEEIINECRDLIKRGYKEITLLGQNVNSYQDPTPTLPLIQGEGELLPLVSRGSRAREAGERGSKIDFPKLLKEIDNIKGDYWLRFITSHPKDLSDDLIKIMAKGKHITPYLHLPIQSGDKDILKTMNRKYTPAHYLRLINKVKKNIPDVMISTDIIVGFPGETKKQFLNTIKIFKKIKFDMAYIAKYSPRSGTAAAELKDNVPQSEKARRWQELTEILKKMALENNKKLMGKTVRVLVEQYKNNKCLDKTDTFKTVIFESNKNLIGQFVKVKIEKVDSWGLYGKIN